MRFKERVKIGLSSDNKPIYRWIEANSKDELHKTIAVTLVQCGCISDIAERIKEKSPTLKSFCLKEYKPAFIDNLARSTAESYSIYLTLYIIPYLGKQRLDQVTVRTVQEFYDWMASAASHGRKKNLNENTIKRVGGLLNRIFKVAVEMDLIPHNPVKCTMLRINAEKATHHKAMPDDIVKRLKNDIPGLEKEDELLFISLLFYTGMRPEEARGLRWDDISLEKHYALIKRAVTYPKNSHPVIGNPKTSHSYRTVLLPEALIRILTPFADRTGFVCGNENPWCYSKSVRVARSAFQHLNLTGFTCYDFRTTYATQLKESGMSSANVADLMGHADTRMVETVYARTRHEGVMKQLAYIENLDTFK